MKIGLKNLTPTSGPGIYNRFPIEKSKRYRFFNNRELIEPEETIITEITTCTPLLCVYPLYYADTTCCNFPADPTTIYVAATCGTYNWYASSNVTWIEEIPNFGIVNSDTDTISLSYGILLLINQQDTEYIGITLISAVSGDNTQLFYVTSDITVLAPRVSVYPDIVYNFYSSVYPGPLSSVCVENLCSCPISADLWISFIGPVQDWAYFTDSGTWISNTFYIQGHETICIPVNIDTTSLVEGNQYGAVIYIENPLEEQCTTIYMNGNPTITVNYN